MSNKLFKTLDRELSIKSPNTDNTRIKFISTDKDKFKDFYSTGNRMYQSYDTDV